MKAITEFPNFTLAKGLKAKTELTAAGKTPEEISASIGETFKYEGDKLKHFINSLDVAGANAEGLKRVMVVTLTEGETAPPKATKVEETTYIPEFLITTAPTKTAEQGKGKFGKKRDGPKSSPWGMSPEEKAAKNKGAAAKAKPST